MSADRSWDDARAELLANNPELQAAMEDSEPAAQVAMELTRARRELGLSQREVAERMGTTQSVVSRIERMDTTPTLTTVFALAKALSRRVEIRFISATQEPEEPPDLLVAVQDELRRMGERIERLRIQGRGTLTDFTTELAKELKVSPASVKKGLEKLNIGIMRLAESVRNAGAHASSRSR